VPLAAGFLDSDKRIDFVMPGGLLFSTRAAILRDAGADGGGPPPVTRAQLTWNAVPAPTKRWTVAQVADVNRDSLPDVIAGSQYEPDLDVLEGTGSIQMPPFTIPTTVSVTNLVVGDFDFDLNGDIAFVQARPASTEREVAIAYGRALTMPPETPRPAGRLDGIRQVFATPSGVTITSVQKGKDGELPTFSLAVLLASGERQPVAPLLYDLSRAAAPPNARRELTTRGLVASPAVSPSVDLIALAGTADYAKGNGARIGNPTYAVWAAPGTGALSFAAPTSIVSLEGFFAVDRATDQFLVQVVGAARACARRRGRTQAREAHRLQRPRRAQGARGVRVELPAEARQGTRRGARATRLRPSTRGPRDHRQERHRQEPLPQGLRPARL